MSPLSALALLVLAGPAAPETFRAAPLSAGIAAAQPVTAPATYDRRKAAGGGFVLVLRDPGVSDDEAIRMSEAVVLAPGPAASRGAALARSHGVPAVAPLGRWEAGRLLLDEPVFGPPRRSADFTFQAVTRVERWPIEEGEPVTVDAASGLVALYAAQRRGGVLELAQALQAYDGLRDGQALVQWWQARAGQAAAEKLGLRLVEGLAGRVALSGGRAADYFAVEAAVESSLARARRPTFSRAAGAAAAARLRKGEAALAALETALRRASSQAALERLRARVLDSCGRLDGLASGLRLPAPSCRAASAQARARLAALAAKPPLTWRGAAWSAGAAKRPSSVVPAEACSEFLYASGLGARISDIVADASLPLPLKSSRIRALLAAARLDPGSPAGRALEAASSGSGLFDFEVEGAAVRSGVAKAGAVKALLESWADYWSPGPLGARLRAGAREAAPQVKVSPTLSPQVSGIVYTGDPATPSPAEVFAARGPIEALWTGPLGEYRLDLASGRARLVSGDPAPAFDAPAQARLARTVRSLGDFFGTGASASFAFQDGALYVLDARPAP